MHNDNVGINVENNARGSKQKTKCRDRTIRTITERYTNR